MLTLTAWVHQCSLQELLWRRGGRVGRRCRRVALLLPRGCRLLLLLLHAARHAADVGAGAEEAAAQCGGEVTGEGLATNGGSYNAAAAEQQRAGTSRLRNGSRPGRGLTRV